MLEPEPVPARYDPPLIVPWYAIGMMALGFVLLSLAARGTNTLAIDLRVSEFVQRFDGTIGRRMADIGNVLGESTFGLALLAIAWVGFAVLRRRRELWFALFLVLGRILATQLKDLFDSPRPLATQIDVIGSHDHLGFPSGHVTTATISLGAVAWTVARMLPQADQRLLAACWGIGVALSAWARIWYGAHWFTDTIGGLLVGLVVVSLGSNLSFGLTRADRASFRRRRPAQTPPPTGPPTG